MPPKKKPSSRSSASTSRRSSSLRPDRDSERNDFRGGDRKFTTPFKPGEKKSKFSAPESSNRNSEFRKRNEDDSPPYRRRNSEDEQTSFRKKDTSSTYGAPRKYDDSKGRKPFEKKNINYDSRSDSGSRAGYPPRTDGRKFESDRNPRSDSRGRYPKQNDASSRATPYRGRKQDDALSNTRYNSEAFDRRDERSPRKFTTDSKLSFDKRNSRSTDRYANTESRDGSKSAFKKKEHYVVKLSSDQDSRKKPRAKGPVRTPASSGGAPRRKQPTSAPGISEPMRLNKYIAHCGICSRRTAMEYVKAGQIQVNGSVMLEPGYLVLPTDAVLFKGNPCVPQTGLVYLLLNKPKDYLTTTEDDRGRQTVMELIDPADRELRIFPVGRLDRNTTGLLLLTNDGDLAKKLMHPSHKVPKVYHLELDKPVHRADLDKIRGGITLEDGKAMVDWVDYLKAGDKTQVAIELHIGKNRIVRRIFEAIGYEVIRLDRVWYAGLNKRDLPRGRYRHLSDREVTKLKHLM